MCIRDRSGGHLLGAAQVDLLRPLDRVHQQQRFPVFHLEKSLGYGGDLLIAVLSPQRQLAGDDRDHNILMLRHHAVHAVNRRHGERGADAVEKCALRRKNTKVKRVHHTSPLSIFFALASASSSVPTL